MVVPEQAVPALSAELLLPFCQCLFQLYHAQGSQVPLGLSLLLVQADMLELKYHGELAAIRIAVELCPLRVRSPGFSHSDEIPLLEGLPAHLPDKLVEPGAVGSNTQVRLLGDLVNDIQAEAAHALVHPPQDHVVDLPADFLVLPVQIRLFHGKLVEIILLKLRNPLPGRAPESCLHVIGKLPFHAVPPHIVVMVRIVFALLRLLEPAVLVGGVVQHQVHDDADPSLLCLRNKLLHVSEAAEHGVYVLVIGYVVAVVILGRPAHGREPDSVNAKLPQVVQPADDTRDVSDAVAVAVLEAAGIDLIDHRLLPPFSFCRPFTHKCSSPFHSVRRYRQAV